MIDTLPIHHLSRVLSLLRNGNIVGFPTGTVYGLGVNALDKSALERLSLLKGRDPKKTYSLLLPANAMDEYVKSAPEEHAVLTKLSDRPLTLLLRPEKTLTHLALDGYVGIRTTDHPFTKNLADELEFPITATSANKSGEPAARSIEEIRTSFPDADFMVVDGGVLPDNPPSTVARYESGKWNILRQGEVTITDLKKADGQTPSLK